jgi:DNA-binding winged helix-turn-helix (wHTH) protein/pimeloyl-ACP methyl ester carboxylesterase
MRYRFGACTLCTDSHTLEVGGAPVHIEPQVFDILLLLVRHAGRLVSHDQLMSEVWGGRIVSDTAVSARISAARSAIGDDGRRQDWIRTVPRRGFRFTGAVEEIGPEHSVGVPHPAAGRQRVGMCRSHDGVRIAYARSGSGPPLIRAGHWLTHLEHDWHSPIWRPILDELGRSFTLCRYDQRGNGLSAHDVDDLSLDTAVEDLSAVVNAAGFDRFVLYGISQGSPVAIRYAVRNPDKVSQLILQGGYERGRRLRDTPGEATMSEAMVTMIREGWGRPGSAYLRMFAAMYISGGSMDQIASLAELQRLCTPVENAWRLRQAYDGFSVRGELAQVNVPTLVIHARDDAVHPINEGLALAEGIPGAQFVMLESGNHVILPQEPAWDILFSEIRHFAGAAHESD